MSELNEVTKEIWDSLFTVNVKAFVPHMKKQSAGAIVNVGSIAGVSGIGSSIPYAAKNLTIHTMTRSFAILLTPNVHINCISGSGRHTLVGWE